MERTVVTLLKDGDRVRGRVRLRPRARPLHACSTPRRWCWPPAASAAPSRSPATAGSTPATATRWPTTPAPTLHGHGVRAVPSHRHGLAAQRARHPRHRRRARRGRRAAQQRRPAASCSTTSRRTTSSQTADNEEEGWRYTQGDKNARRPPELLTRDHVARCIIREVKAGRGSPHGGVFLDIAWIKEKLPNARRAHQEEAAQHVSPVQAAGRHRHHQGADGDRPDHALHDGRRARRWRHADVDGARPVRRRRVRRGHCTAPTGSAAIRSPTCWSSASAPASTRRSSPRSTARRPDRRRRRSTRRPSARWRRSSADGAARTRITVQHELQDMMQDLVGIVRDEERDAAGARRASASLRHERPTRRRHGQPRVQPGLAHGARSAQSADGVRGDRALARWSARKAAARTSATTIRRRSAEWGKINIVIAQGRGRRACRCRARAGARRCRRAEADHRGDEVDGTGDVSDLARRRGAAASFVDYTTEVSDGMVVLDAVHRSRPTQANDLAVRWNCKAGKCGSCSAEINGKPRLMCMTRLEPARPRPAGDRRADADVSARSRTW